MWLASKALMYFDPFFLPLLRALASTQHSQHFSFFFFLAEGWHSCLQQPVSQICVCVSVCSEGKRGYVIPCDRKGKFVSTLQHFLLLWKCGLTVQTTPTSLSINKDIHTGIHIHTSESYTNTLNIIPVLTFTYWPLIFKPASRTKKNQKQGREGEEKGNSSFSLCCSNVIFATQGSSLYHTLKSHFLK